MEEWVFNLDLLAAGVEIFLGRAGGHTFPAFFTMAISSISSHAGVSVDHERHHRLLRGHPTGFPDREVTSGNFGSSSSYVMGPFDASFFHVSLPGTMALRGYSKVLAATAIADITY